MAEKKNDHVDRLRKGIVTVMASVEIGPGTRVPPFFVRDIDAACDEVERLRAEVERLREALREIWFAPVSDDTAVMRTTAKRALLSPSEDKTDGE